MKENKECKIVQDLLPNYIEKLTNEETNKFIEEHLKNCEDCKKNYDDMKESLNKNNKNKEKKKVNFLKKYKNKLRILEIILLIIIVAFVVNTGRKVYIITDLNNKAEKYINSTNYHKIVYSLDKGNYTKSEVYSLDNKKKIILTTLTEDGKKEVVTIYGTKIGNAPDTPYAMVEPPIGIYKQNVYKETETEKKVTLNLESEIAVEPQKAFYGIENIKQLIVCAITSSINKTTYDGNKCYYVSGMPSILLNSSMYVNKDTGLAISLMASEYENPDGERGRVAGAEYKYEFGTVTEDDFIEPDISEYKIEDANDYINQ